MSIVPFPPKIVTPNFNISLLHFHAKYDNWKVLPRISMFTKI